jgi:CubicO group peptidase (beta-lactamase class C family)
LKAWIPFYKFADNKIFSSLKSDNYHIIVTENIFLRNDYRDTIFKQIIDSPLIPLTYSGLNSHNTESHIYLYSDLGFYLFADMILRITGMQIDEYVYENFYKPMGLNRIVYCPLNKFSTEEIVPTEYDSAFRKQLIHGYVHDPGAAMLGGISGHAGLFANAGSLASLMQMLLQNGAYNGKQYISQATVREFTRYQFPENNNRRALGFDKPVPDKAHINKNQLNCAESASKNSFGHSGFTGTFLWVDPDYHLVYVFLSNRVYPDSKNNKLSEMNIRTNIQQVIYNGLLKTNPQISKPK